jgi:hypothetical protein
MIAETFPQSPALDLQSPLNSQISPTIHKASKTMPLTPMDPTHSSTEKDDPNLDE